MRLKPTTRSRLRNRRAPVTDWRSPVDSNLDVAEIFTAWKASVTAVKPPILQAALRAYAFVESVSMTDDDIRAGLSMKEGGIDIESVVKLLSNIFKLELTQAYLSQSTILSPKIQEAIILRLIAQTYPTKDNIVETKSVSVPLADYLPKQPPKLKSSNRPEPSAFLPKPRLKELPD